MIQPLFISEDLLREYSPLSGTIDFDYLKSHIVTAQDYHLQPTLGGALFTRLSNGIYNEDLTEVEQLLVDDYIAKMLVHYALYDAISFLVVKLESSGIVTKSLDNSTAISFEDARTLEAKTVAKAEFYKQRLINYLNANSDLYPQYTEDSLLRKSDANYDFGFNFEEDDCQQRASGSGGGGGVTEHNQLTGRTAANSHPISAITDLTESLQALADAIAAIPAPITVHNNLSNRDANDSHPIAAISGLVDALAAKMAITTYDSNADGIVDKAQSIKGIYYTQTAANIGDPAYMSSAPPATIMISKSDATDLAKLPAIGMYSANVLGGDNAELVSKGLVIGLNTLGSTIGQAVYVANGGGWTLTKPKGRSQQIGTIARVGGSDGSILVDPQIVDDKKKAWSHPSWSTETVPTSNDIVIDETAGTITFGTINGGVISAANPAIYYLDNASGTIDTYLITSPVVFTFNKTEGIKWFYFDSTGAKSIDGASIPKFGTVAPIYRAYWDASINGFNTRSAEFHPNTQSAAEHEWKHSAIGTVNISGFDLFNNALTSGSPSATGLNTCVGLSSGVNMDDNFAYTITNGTTGDKWMQDLGTNVAASLSTTTGGIFKTTYNDATGRLRVLNALGKFPFHYSVADGRPFYITSNGTATLVPYNSYFVYFLYALQDDKNGESIRLRSAVVTFATLALAQAYQWENNLAYSVTLGDKEIRPLYRMIFETRSTYDAAVMRSVLREVLNIKSQRIQTASVSSATISGSNVTIIPPPGYISTNQQDLNTELAAAIKVDAKEIVLSQVGIDATASTTVRKRYWRCTFPFTLTSTPITAGVAPSGSTAIFDIHKNGTTIYSTKPTIDGDEFSTDTALTPAVITTTSFATGDLIELFIDQVGLSTAGQEYICIMNFIRS